MGFLLAIDAWYCDIRAHPFSYSHANLSDGIELVQPVGTAQSVARTVMLPIFYGGMCAQVIMQGRARRRRMRRGS